MSRLKLWAAVGAVAAFCAPAAMPQGRTTVDPICEDYFAPRGGVSQRIVYEAKADFSFRGKNNNRLGWFRSNADLAFWSEKYRLYPTGYFTTRKGQKIEFVPDEGPSEEVNFGLVADAKDAPTLFRLNRGVSCNAIIAWLPDTPPPGSSLKDFMDKSMTPRGSSERPGPSAEKGTGRTDVPGQARPKELTELFKSKPPAAPSSPAAPSATAPSPPAVSPVAPPPPPAVTPTTPTPRWDPVVEKPVEPTAVCRFDTLLPLPYLEGTPPRATRTYALRNTRVKVTASDYVDTGGDVLPFPGEVDISTTASKLVSYETVAFLRGKPNPTWVSIPGAKLMTAAADSAKPRPKANLRLVIVSGAQEMLISGLDVVGAELAKAPTIDVKPQIDWHLVEPSGELKFVGRFVSFQTLVEAAAERAPRDERMDVLSEAQLTTMFEQFQSTLLKEPTPLDRVIWIKGAYPVPGSFPPYFERFLTRISDSDALVKLPNGRPGKWLTVITARIRGFSIAYLKEPVYSLQAGDVLEEDPGAIGLKRRLIPDVGLFATRLRTGLKTEVSADAPEASVPSKLVQNAADVFLERGYILPRADIPSLQAYLREVQQLWTDGDKLDAAAVTKFAKGLDLGEPVTLQDLLQGGKPGKFPRLPRSAGDGLRKPIPALTPQDRRETRELANRYLEGVTRISGSLAGEKAQKCAALFVTEEALGIVGNSR